MRNHKLIIIIYLICLCIIVSACGAKPQQNYGKTDPSIKSTTDSNLNSRSDNSKNLQKGLNIEITGKRATLKIQSRDITDYSQYNTYKSSPVFFNRDILLTAAFGENKDKAILVNNEEGTYNGKEYHMELYSLDNIVAYRDDFDGRVYIDYGLGDSETLGSYNDTTEENQELDDIAHKCKITKEEAIEKANDYLSELKISAMLYETKAYGRMSDSAGFYRITYLQTIEGVPVSGNGFKSERGNAVLPSIGVSVTVGDLGVAAFGGNLFEYVQIESMVNTIAFEAALEVLRKNIDVLPSLVHEPVTSISLIYLNTFFSDNEVITIPVWNFSSGLNVATNVHTNVNVNAITGEIVR